MEGMISTQWKPVVVEDSDIEEHNVSILLV